MSSPAILDFERALAPISADSPCGDNLRDDATPTSMYYRIKDARAASRAYERMLASGETSDGGPRWREVVDLGVRVLNERSKDLEVCAWLIEAFAREQRFAGLRDGFRLTRELVERYWDGLYPKPDEDGLITKVAAIVGLNGSDAEGTLIAPISLITITDRKGQGPFSSWHFRQANDISRITEADKRDKRIAAGGISLEEFNKAARETSVDFYREEIADLEAALEEWKKLSAVLDARCGSESPPSSNIRAQLVAVLDDVRAVARDILPPEEAVDAAIEAADQNGSPKSGRVNLDGIKSRDDALRALGKVAEYFRHAEPHSPMSYLIDQSVRWGRMPLHDLLGELIPDDSARDKFCKLTGVRLAKE